jgi:uncharacterized protein with FMN-binding domain
MSTNSSPRGFNLIRSAQKFLVSAFVLFTYVIYALHERFAGPPSEAVSVATPTESLRATQQVFTAPPVSPPTQALPVASQLKLAPPTPLPTATAILQGLYKDGEYTGDRYDVIYGIVQVKAVIQNGKIAQVQFLEYPNDRRTSVRINTVAMPYLTNEAIQAQNANVNIISGATLTSEGFILSLQSALATAKVS